MKCVQVAVVLILCYFPKINASCNQVLGKGVTSGDKKLIVDEHNEFRLSVANGHVPGQPKAANMKRIRWDNNLAIAAQNGADTCDFEHKKVDDPRFSVGQNLFWSANTAENKTANWVEAVYSWYKEFKIYKFGSAGYDHYTQVVWANTTLVGCGYINYKNHGKWFEKLYVCNYGPAGNYAGESPYKVGEGCENLC